MPISEEKRPKVPSDWPKQAPKLETVHIRQTSKLVSRFGNTRVLGQAVPNPVFINGQTTNAKESQTQKDP